MRTILILILSGIFIPLKAITDFDKYFSDKVLRFDFMLAGNSNNTVVYPVGMKEEPYWSGSKTSTKDIFNFGNFKYEVFDAAEDILIYSKGFSTLYQEWQTTAEAKTMERSFYEVATMPFPKNKVRFVISIRQKNGFTKLYETIIDPADYFIRKEKPVSAAVTRIYGEMDPGKAVDLAFIAEGYTAEEMDKFRQDVKLMADALFAEDPFSEYRKYFNIWAVEAISQESGTDIPGENLYVNTVLNSSFYTFNLDRYLTTQDIEAVNDYAALVPHDNIVMLINSDKYGGGGVYNYYSGTTAGHRLSEIVFVHEFGHGFVGLADEYYTSSVSYEDFYPLDIEPWEPNITTLVDFDSKWKKMIETGIPVPTPPSEKYKNSLGAFEGGGYSAKGIYRPEMECRMKSNTKKGFCGVCRNAIVEMIEFYIK
jgi:hypothetical protein